MRKVLRLKKAPHVFYGWNPVLAKRNDKLEEAWFDETTGRLSDSPSKDVAPAPAAPPTLESITDAEAVVDSSQAKMAPATAIKRRRGRPPKRSILSSGLEDG